MFSIPALPAAAVYAAALVLSRLGSAAEQRLLLLLAPLLVLALPLLPGLPALAPPPDWELPILAAAPAAGPALQEPAPGAARPDLWAWAWASGAAIAGARLFADLLAARRLAATARDRVGDVAISDAVEVPLVIGSLRPVVLLPPEAAAWSAPRRAQVLAHEAAHVAGRDNLWLLLARVAACVHWFDPLAWLSLAALRDAAERRADQAALAAGADPVDYARTLVELARRVPGAVLAMARPGGIEGRVRAVLGGRRPGRPLQGLVGIGLLAGVAVGTNGVHAAGSAPDPARVDRVIAAEADRLVAAYQPEGVAIVVLDPQGRRVLGQVDRGGLLDRPVAPGSVFKPFTVAAALEAGVPADSAFPDGTMAEVLACSSNAGAVAIGERVGRDAIERIYGRVGLPVPAGLALEQLVLGELLVSPRRIAASWLELAGGGALAPGVAAEVRAMLVGVSEAERGTAPAAALPGLHVAGKTGTARWPGPGGEAHMLSSFVGFAPAADPELLVLVMVAAPRTEEAWGGKVAAPAFARIVGALLD